MRKWNLKKVRKQHGLNQQQFWQRIGITQSGGSRYEGGRAVPKSVRILLMIAYGDAFEQTRATQHINGLTDRL